MHLFTSSTLFTLVESSLTPVTTDVCDQNDDTSELVGASSSCTDSNEVRFSGRGTLRTRVHFRVIMSVVKKNLSDASRQSATDFMHGCSNRTDVASRSLYD